MDSNPDLEKLIQDALAAFDDWCQQHDSTDVEQFLAETKLPGRVIDEVRAHVQREQALQEMFGGDADVDANVDPDLKTQGPSTQPHRTERKPQREWIGQYKLLQIIGEGGMGTVWMAEQEKPVKRRVALKVIKAGLDSETIIARFEAERQALAIMDHQNIARVLDVGVTDDGRPYFAMELVKGVPLNTYCDNNKLSIEERLRLFVPICHAVQHAHQKGIIHRDLKPTNVLVTLYDGLPVPKVIDFGLAKALDHQRKLTDKTLFTEFGMIVGTLQYMSPEQAEMNAIDVDTRTDIYSLGVMLYELLTGSTPIERSTLKEQTMIQILNFIRTKEPPRPSKRLSESRDAATGISQQRKINPDRLSQLLKGELDWIVMKSIEKDRSRRYDSAKGFADDVERFLKNEVVAARPPTASYLFRKFVKRNRSLVATAAAFAMLMIISTIVLAFLWQRAQAYAQELEAADKKTNQFLTNLANDIGENLTGSDVSKMDTESDPQERIIVLKAVTLTRIGLYIQQLGASSKNCLTWFEKAIESFEQLGEDTKSRYLASYGTALDNAGRINAGLENNDAAETLFVKAIETREESWRINQSQVSRESLAVTLLNSSLTGNKNAKQRLSRMIEVLEPSTVNTDRRLLAKGYHNRAFNQQGAEQVADAVKAIDVFEEYLKAKGGEPSAAELGDLARFYDWTSTVQPDPEVRLEFGRKAVELTERQLLASPDSAGLQFYAANMFYNFGTKFFPHGANAVEGLKWFDKSIAQLEKLRRIDSTIIGQNVYYLAYLHRAEALIQCAGFDKAKESYDVLVDLEANEKAHPDVKLNGKMFWSRWLRCIAQNDIAQAIQLLEQEPDLIGGDYAEKCDVLYTAAAIYALASGARAEPRKTNSQWPTVRWNTCKPSPIKICSTMAKRRNSKPTQTSIPFATPKHSAVSSI